jgi:arabinofuranosyltransferase
MFSWGTGPEVHVIDSLALTDPLLARVPAKYDKDWRTGHLLRDVPDGYVRTLETGVNLLTDPCLKTYYDKLQLVISGPLFTWDRISAIAALNMPGGVTVRPCKPVVPPALPPAKR